MSERGFVAIQNFDEKGEEYYSLIPIWRMADIQNAGRILEENYNDEKSLKELSSISGKNDIEYLGPFVDTTELTKGGASFKDKISGNKIKNITDILSVVEQHGCSDFLYVYTNNLSNYPERKDEVDYHKRFLEKRWYVSINRNNSYSVLFGDIDQKTSDRILPHFERFTPLESILKQTKKEEIPAVYTVKDAEKVDSLMKRLSEDVKTYKESFSDRSLSYLEDFLEDIKTLVTKSLENIQEKTKDNEKENNEKVNYGRRIQ